MGRGLALEFRQKWPKMYVEYSRACRNGSLRPGTVQPVRIGEGMPEWVINFPTKDDWRNPSQLEYIEKGLEDLVKAVRSIGIRSIALPALGSEDYGTRKSEI